MLKETRGNRTTEKKQKTKTKTKKEKHETKKKQQFVSSAEKGNLSLKISFRKVFRI
jgi:hypothetical protein